MRIPCTVRTYWVLGFGRLLALAHLMLFMRKLTFPYLPVLLLATSCTGSSPIDDQVDDESKIPAVSTSTSYNFPPGSGVLDVTQAPYNAVPNDGVDDTAAIQRAIADAFRTRPQTVYFPDGVYNVSDRLTDGSSYKRITLQGQSRAGTIIRLADNTPSYATAKDLISFYDGTGGNAVAFRNHVVGLTLDIGQGNPGAIALRFHASNEGVVRDVKIISSDPQHLGNTGLRITRNSPGPLLVQDVIVDGFDAGIEVIFDRYSVTMNNIEVRNQRVVGVRNTTNTVSIRGLTSVNAVPAVINATNAAAGGGGMMTLIDSDLSGGSASVDAIQNAAGSDLFVRNTNVNGYAVAVRDAAAAGATVATGRVAEYLTNSRVVRPLSTVTTSLGIAVPATPFTPWAPVSDWAPVSGAASDDTASFQAALNSGKSTVYLPRDGSAYAISGTITVPATVQRIIGIENILSIAAGTVLRVAESTTAPLQIERFENFPLIELAAARDVVLRDSFVGGVFNSVRDARLFVENVSGSNWDIGPGMSLYGYQVNTEAKSATAFNIRNRGGTAWILGLKTEGPRAILATSERGRSEVLGGYILPSSGTDAVPAFSIDNASATFRFYNEPSVYALQVRETNSGSTNDLLSSQIFGFHGGKIMPLYSSRRVQHCDFNGDGVSDPSIWRASIGDWYFLNTSNGAGTNLGSWGLAAAPYNDIPVPGDFDGDGKTDRAVWRATTGEWYVVYSSTGQATNLGSWGLAAAPYNDVPLVADFDGDGKTDRAVWRATTGEWFVIYSSTGQGVNLGSWGLAAAPYNDVPVAGDYDGDGKTDRAVWRATTGEWYVVYSSTGQPTNLGSWGLAAAPYNDVAVAGDYDGDGKTDRAVWRATTGEWFVIYSSTGQGINLGSWGLAAAPYGDLPIAGDYDGDGRQDPSVWRTSTGEWFALRSSTGQGVNFGAFGTASAPYNDVALPVRYGAVAKI
jgi:uncharacterized cupin superfamily protein